MVNVAVGSLADMAAVFGMSALPPIADIKADIALSAKCQEPTWRFPFLEAETHSGVDLKRVVGALHAMPLRHSNDGSRVAGQPFEEDAFGDQVCSAISNSGAVEDLLSVPAGNRRWLRQPCWS